MKRDERKDDFLWKMLKNPENPSNELVQNVSKKNPFEQIIRLSSKVQILPFFLLFQKGFRAAQYLFFFLSPL